MSGGTSGPASVGRQDTLANSFLQRQKLGGARSPLRAAIHTPGKVRRAEDCPPYQSGCDGARHSGAQ